MSESNFECPVCKGCGYTFELKKADLFNNGYFTPFEYEFAIPCYNCNGGHESKVKTVKQYSNTPAGFSDKDLKAFNWKIYRKEDNTEIDTTEAQKFVRSFVKQYAQWKEAGQGLYIHSKVKGSGKTFLASCILNEVMKLYAVRTRFVPCIDLLTIAQTQNSKGTSEEECDPIGFISKIPLIVIDDIGVKNPNSWIDEVLFKIVDTRDQKKLPTIFTSNVTIDELQYDERVTDRIYKMCQPVSLPEVKVRRRETATDRTYLLSKLGL